MMIFHRIQSGVRKKKGPNNPLQQIFTAHRRGMIDSRNAPAAAIQNNSVRPRNISRPWYADSAVDAWLCHLWQGKPMFDMRRRELVTLFGVLPSEA